MGPRLRDILAAKRRELTSHGESAFPAPLDEIPPLRDFKKAVCRPDRIGIIAEIKFASPSSGIIRRAADPVKIAHAYERAGTAAISVVTETKYFNGNPETLLRVRRVVSIPVLRKDFIIDESQIHESRRMGADAVLLIARILSRRRLASFLDLCACLGMAALTEVHSLEDMERALTCGAEIIGINNRDLDSFEVSLDTTLRLARTAPRNCCLVSESGISEPEDLLLLKSSGITAALVGTALMAADDPGEAAARLVREAYHGGRGVHDVQG